MYGFYVVISIYSHIHISYHIYMWDCMGYRPLAEMYPPESIDGEKRGFPKLEEPKRSSKLVITHTKRVQMWPGTSKITMIS